METKTRPGLTGNQLKILAMLTMPCDHVGLYLLPQFPVLGFWDGWQCRFTPI